MRYVLGGVFLGVVDFLVILVRRRLRLRSTASELYGCGSYIKWLHWLKEAHIYFRSLSDILSNLSI